MSQPDGYSPLVQKQWKGLTYDYAGTLEGTEGLTCLVCLTDFQRAWLQANVPYMRWETRWSNLAITSSELNQHADDLELALMSCIEINPYQIDYTYQQQVQNQLNQFADDYTGTPSSVNSNTPDDFFSGDGSDERVDALCTAINVYVYSYSANWSTKAQIALGVAGVITTALSLTLVGGVIAGTILAGLALITAVALDAMNDEDALDAVVCCMLDAMNGGVINAVNFEASLDACGFLVGSNEAIVRDIIASDLDQLSNLLSFYNVLGEQFLLAQVGVIDCPCIGEETIIVTFDGAGYQLYTIEEGSLDLAFGNPLPSVESVFNVGFNTTRSFVRVELDANRTVKEIKFDGWATNPSNFWTFYAEARDEFLVSLGIIVNDQTQTGNEVWVNKTVSGLSIPNVRYVDFIVGKTGTPFTLYEDTLTITYETV